MNEDNIERGFEGINDNQFVKDLLLRELAGSSYVLSK